MSITVELCVKNATKKRTLTAEKLTDTDMPKLNESKIVRAIEIRAEVRQIKTMVDHSVNVTLNLPEECIPQAQKLMEWIGLEIHAVIENVPSGMGTVN